MGTGPATTVTETVTRTRTKKVVPKPRVPSGTARSWWARTFAPGHTGLPEAATATGNATATLRAGSTASWPTPTRAGRPSCRSSPRTRLSSPRDVETGAGWVKPRPGTTLRGLAVLARCLGDTPAHDPKQRVRMVQRHRGRKLPSLSSERVQNVHQVDGDVPPSPPTAATWYSHRKGAPYGRDRRMRPSTRTIRTTPRIPTRLANAIDGMDEPEVRGYSERSTRMLSRSFPATLLPKPVKSPRACPHTGRALSAVLRAGS